jgi:hypothetical protein
VTSPQGYDILNTFHAVTILSLYRRPGLLQRRRALSDSSAFDSAFAQPVGTTIGFTRHQKTPQGKSLLRGQAMADRSDCRDQPGP